MLSNARLVMLQFSFSNPGVIPAAVKKLENEAPEEWFARKARYGTSAYLIEPVENVSLSKLLAGVEQAGYQLTDAFYRPRLDQKERTYHTARFVFCRPEHANPCPELAEKRELIRSELGKMCEQAAWRVRAYLNPFFQKGEEVA